MMSSTAAPVEQFASARLAEPDQRRQHAVRVMVVTAEHEVVQHGQVGEQLDVLERAGYPELGDLVGALAD